MFSGAYFRSCSKGADSVPIYSLRRSFSDEGFGGSDVDARDVSGEFEDVLERDFEALEDMD